MVVFFIRDDDRAMLLLQVKVATWRRVKNWIMAMARRSTGDIEISARVMLSAEPLTVGAHGYPLLLQTGESASLSEGFATTTAASIMSPPGGPAEGSDMRMPGSDGGTRGNVRRPASLPRQSSNETNRATVRGADRGKALPCLCEG
jgi:hypothetical protein